MARFKRFEDIYQAVDAWKEKCLLNESSVFSDEELWSVGVFSEIENCYSKNLDEGEGSFFEKLEDQVKSSSPEAKRLFAEMIWLYFLISRQMKPETKRNRIRTVWGWSGSTLVEQQAALQDGGLEGVLNPGTAYNTLLWKEIVYFIDLMLVWLSQSLEDLRSLLQDPLKFCTWLDDRRDSEKRMLRSILVYLLFPDTFQPIVNSSHKRAIVSTFNQKWEKTVDLSSRTTLLALDQLLLDVTNTLQTQYPNKEINFFRPPFVKEWKGTEDEVWYKKRFGKHKVWLWAPGEGGGDWEAFLNTSIVAIDYGDFGDLSNYGSEKELDTAVIDAGFGPNPFNTTLALWYFGSLAIKLAWETLS